ncbi:MAG: adenylate/guanylate cyclase domain-containing protein, partial [Chloroflexota bacterium]
MSHNPSHTELTAIYLPIDRRHALAYGLQLPRQAHGAALFADISGFTVLTESLKRSLGPRQGAERLAIYLNQVYDALIAEVDRYGGSVIGFSGDAITCWFDDTFIHRVYAACGLEQPSAQPAVLRAVTAALAIQKAMLQFSTIEVPGQGVFPLRVKAAVACGQVQRLLVGDPQHQLLDATAGETLLRMAAAEKQALPSQTIVDQATTAALGDQLEIEQQLVDEYGQHFSVIRGMRRPAEAIPWPALPGERLDEGQISPWLLKPVYQRLVQLQGEFLTELRPAAALFLRFSGIDFENDPACGEALDGYIRWVQTIVARYDGTFIQLTVGEKGSYLYVAFGAPRAHEDDPLRAARAALELARTPAQLAGIRQVQIGLSLGAMRTGSYGGRTRRTYGVLGDDVNLAARLMQAAAPGQILASGQLREALGPACRWQDLPPMQVKGKNEPVPVAALLGLMDWQPVIFAGRRPLVGRKAELEQAVQAGARLSSIPPSFAGAIVLDGDAGIGKSRLAQELHEQLGEWQELRWLECPCDAILGQSLHPFKYWLRRYFNQDS